MVAKMSLIAVCKRCKTAEHFLQHTKIYLSWSCFLRIKRSIIPKMTFRLVLQLDPFNLTTLSLIKHPDKDVLSSPQRKKKLPNFNKKVSQTACKMPSKENRPIPFQKTYPFSSWRQSATQMVYGSLLMPYLILAYHLKTLQHGSLKPLSED